MGDRRVDHAELMQGMAEFAAALVDGDYDVTEMLFQLSDQSLAVLGIDGAGVSLRNADGDLEVVTATDGRASRMQHAQARAQDGPCVHAHRSGEVVTVADLATDTRWPDLRETATVVGYRATAAVPMPVTGETIGTLDLYADRPGRWDGVIEAATLLADMAAGYVLMARTLQDERTRAAQLQHALDSRVVVEQAKGMLAARHGLGVDEAFERLRRHARSHRRRVVEVAEEVVAGRNDLRDEPRRPAGMH